MINTNDTSSIQYIFAKPYIEGYYLYGVNSIEELNAVQKDKLRDIVINLQCSDIIKLNYLLDRAFPFLYDNTKRELKQFQITNKEPSKEEIGKSLRKEMYNLTVPKQSSPLKAQYKSLFQEGLLLKRFNHFQ